MKAVVTYQYGGFTSPGAHVSTWAVTTDDSQYDTSAELHSTMPVTDSTQYAAFMSDLRDCVIAAVVAVGGPTMAQSDITVMGGPAV